MNKYERIQFYGKNRLIHGHNFDSNNPEILHSNSNYNKKKIKELISEIKYSIPRAMNAKFSSFGSHDLKTLEFSDCRSNETSWWFQAAKLILIIYHYFFCNLEFPTWRWTLIKFLIHLKLNSLNLEVYQVSGVMLQNF